MPTEHPEPPRDDSGAADTRYEPPFSPDVLAELHAGALPDDVAARVHARLDEDPAAADILAALDRVSADLGAVGADLSAATPIPPEIADRIGRALARETAGMPAAPPGRTSEVVPLDRNRRRRLVLGGGVVAAAAAALVAVVLVLPFGEQSDAPTMAAPTATTPTGTPVDLGAGLQPGQIMTLIGSRELGPLVAPDTLAGCLEANGIEPGRPLLGSKEVRIDGRTGVLLILAGPQPPQLTALVVGEGCAAGNADTIATRDIG
ncbi:hypothetical protein G4H71_10165 [Rhodococcus triatomae]|uniref:Anti-sigma-M factor RsmA n=1 Tax=Rhodococcus triatomae TaxID=300028 RepID=A0A1G8R0G5_9NOCA|nr:hypothetical protein [Rhodococcus triatomae]QNG20733.1 hypothetical protein G4H72_20220 [Rhodococcus triatomae]QNG23350.1 hypothetical protein G4H71_10165 [Rhodococcus triatomae]SDJ10431.1 hypothetical protein SAMN05444695_11671 [Rhodococcus triatomae]